MATREITQLPDRFTGDINNIRDKKIAEASDATAASDITSQCEYLIKNGQTGEFMNVLKSYIDESIRSALGALVSNLDKGTSISKVLATDANNDLGSITPANLASVLSVKDFRTYTAYCSFSGTQTLNTNVPFDSGIMILYSPSSGFGGVYFWDDNTFKVIAEGGANKWTINSARQITHTGGRCSITYISGGAWA